MRGPVTTRNRSAGQASPRERDRVHHPMQQGIADARAAHGHDAEQIVGPEPQPGPRGRPFLRGRRREPGDVSGEIVVRGRPLADPRQPRPERLRHDVVRVPDEDRAIAQPPVSRPLLEHLGVVVGGECGLGIPSARHRQPPHEVGHPREREALQLGVLVEEVVDIPRLVADHEVVIGLVDDVVEDHEVVHEDLVHPADRLERVQVVVGGLVFDVRGLVGEPGGCRMHRFSGIRQHSRDGMLRQPVDLQVGVEPAQFLRDRDIPPRVPESDRGREEQRTLRAALRPHPGMTPARHRRHRSSVHLPMRRCQGRTSKTRLNGVSVALRKRVKPPAAVTSRIRAGPACAPRARPTSWESDAGVHSNVEKP